LIFSIVVCEMWKIEFTIQDFQFVRFDFHIISIRVNSRRKLSILMIEIDVLPRDFLNYQYVLNYCMKDLTFVIY
jgi:hypothetical protein